MPLEIIKHPLAEDCLAKLRDINTDYTQYMAISRPLAILIAITATHDLPTKTKNITTPMCDSLENILANPIILVPILRAGLSMLAPIQEMFVQAKTGFIGLERSEHLCEPQKYFLKIPQDPNAVVLVLDPMIATGGSACAALTHLKKLGFSKIKLLSFVAAPEGISNLKQTHPDITVYTAALDQKLDENYYIIPGLGDFGDRLFGTSSDGR